jgi:hypothetical protein
MAALLVCGTERDPNLGAARSIVARSGWECKGRAENEVVRWLGG